jgi:membrane protease YdiL (CAAX protease family)
VTAAVHPLAGLIAHGLLLVVLLIAGAVAPHPAQRAFALALTLAPLIRLLSLALPLPRFPQAFWYPLVSTPLLIATWVVARQLGVRRTDLGLRIGRWPFQIMLSGLGLTLGAIEYSILAPAPMVPELTWATIWVPALSLLIFTGFSEELIFRGLLQWVAGPILGAQALVYVALLFGVLHIGYLSAIDVLFVFAVGVLFAYLVRSTGSLLGVSLAHGVTNITLFIVMPQIAYSGQYSIGEVAFWIGWLGMISALPALLVFTMEWRYRRLLPQPIAVAGDLRVLRRRIGLTYTDLAVRTGLPTRLICEFEIGVRLPTPNQLELLHQSLGVAEAQKKEVYP